MNAENLDTEAQSDPFQVLGIAMDATEEDVRNRYLELVKKFPPEREPEKFREIQSAYEAARDPVELAGRLVAATCSDDAPPTWQSVIQRFSAQPPRSSLSFLMSLGNQTADYVQARESSNSPSEQG